MRATPHDSKTLNLCSIPTKAKKIYCCHTIPLNRYVDALHSSIKDCVCTIRCAMREIPTSAESLNISYSPSSAMRWLMLESLNRPISLHRCGTGTEHIDSETKGIVKGLMIQTVNGFPSVIKCPVNVVGPSSWWPPPGHLPFGSSRNLSKTWKSCCIKIR